MLEQMLAQRRLPPLTDRETMVETLCREVYGDLPDTPYEVTVSAPTVIDQRLDCGTCALSRVELTVTTAHGSHTFPVHRLLHRDGAKRPFFIFMNIYPAVPSLYYPVELIAERGFDVLSFCYKEATSDDGDFTNGVAGLLLPNGQDTPRTGGKLMLWAWCAMRVLDYALTLPGLDPAQGAVIGHSRLGKTALLAGMLDTRFRYVFPNNAGCAGDAIARGGLGATGGRGKHGGEGESVRVITNTFPYWFNKTYPRHRDANVPEGFDQHYLLATIAPRYVMAGSADMDDWADPVSQQLSCLAAGKLWETVYGVPGLVHHDRILEPGEQLIEGRVGYHRRAGMHFLSYHDWMAYMDFIDRHKGE